VPDYMKIDIEGNDRICISGLTCHRTPIVSIEMDHSASDRDLHILAKLGYQGFKVICQNNSWHQVTARNIGFYEWPPHHFIIRRLRKLRAAPSRGCGNGAMAEPVRHRQTKGAATDMFGLQPCSGRRRFADRFLAHVRTSGGPTGPAQPLFRLARSPPTLCLGPSLTRSNRRGT
jgi:hypothetical protein